MLVHYGLYDLAIFLRCDRRVARVPVPMALLEGTNSMGRPNAHRQERQMTWERQSAGWHVPLALAPAP